MSKAIFARHDGNEKDYLFEVPPYIKVHKGDVLLVDTKHGEEIAVATSEVFESENIDDIAAKYGAYLPLKKVKQACGRKIRQYITQKVLKPAFDEISNALLKNGYLPF